ncbi:hypothetical protein ACN42_g11694 [Penicillium freii]|uniref:Uncharacterized protein n=1 Tax=Penicillium freii TaxID=48697 RepID=A0A101M7Q3_PENFR|nr:hypothetical protein ACN42_g11694 [Penicillium freii]
MGQFREVSGWFWFNGGIAIANTIRKIRVFPWQLNAPAFKLRTFQFRATPIEVEKPNKGARGEVDARRGLTTSEIAPEDMTMSVPPHLPRHHMIALESPTRLQRGSQGSCYDMMTNTKRVGMSPRFETPGIWNACAMHGKVNLLLLENNRVNIDSKTAAGEILMY